MKTITLITILTLTSPGLLQANSIEQLRKSSEDISINTQTLSQRSAAATRQYEIQPTRVEGLDGLAKLVEKIFDLIFGNNGDIEIANPRTDVPEVEGTLPDDDVQEEYIEGYTYADLNPEDYTDDSVQPYQPQSPQSPQSPQQPQQPGLGAEGNSGVIPADLKRKALEQFSANADKIKNKRYIGIVDFAEHSSRARFFILDMQTGETRAIRVAHGSGSDPDGDGYATKFSNVPNSKASSLGVYVTGALYYGKHGKSMRLHGLSSTNSNALSRAVVLHESAYVQEANMRQGRSWGCLAVASSEIRRALATLNGGAMIYAGLSNSKF